MRLLFQLDSIPAEEVVFTILEELPEFPGGERALCEYLKDNVSYPEEALKKGIEGVVHGKRPGNRIL